MYFVLNCNVLALLSFYALPSGGNRKTRWSIISYFKNWKSTNLLILIKATIYWNRALWLVERIHLTWCSQSEGYSKKIVRWIKFTWSFLQAASQRFWTEQIQPASSLRQSVSVKHWWQRPKAKTMLQGAVVVAKLPRWLLLTKHSTWVWFQSLAIFKWAIPGLFHLYIRLFNS